MTLELHEPAGATPLTPDELLGLKADELASLRAQRVTEPVTERKA